MKSHWIIRLGKAILTALAVACVLAVVRTAASDIVLDFPIYHEAARRMLAGTSPYEFYGEDTYPYQYVPWALWLFLPLAALPFRYAWAAFVALNLSLLAAAFTLLLRLHRSILARAEAFLLYGISLLIGLLLFTVGQVGVLQLIAGVLMIVFVCRGRPVLAGAFFPLLCIKPQVVLIAIPALWWAGGRKMVLSSLASTALVVGISVLITPSWIHDLVAVIVEGQGYQQRLVWNFSTLAGLLDLERHWNVIFTIALIPAGALLAYRFRQLPPAAWLSLAFALSLLVAPYAFAYDLLLLLPALIWLTDRWALRTVWLWLVGVVVVGASSYSSGTYLFTVVVTAAALWRARRYLHNHKSASLTPAGAPSDSQASG